MLLVAAALVLAAGSSWPEPGTNGMRLILNQSADSMFECVAFKGHLNASATRDMLIEGYQGLVDDYARTSVSHIFFNVNFQRAAYDSAVCETYWDVPDPERDAVAWSRMSWYVHKAGVDPFQVCVERCRDRDISPWISVRMNDTHYNDDRHRIFSLWWNRPEFRRGVGGFHDGLDFAQEEVRTLYMNLIREVIERYDSDGLELDWMRFPYHFKPGQEEAGLDILTTFLLHTGPAPVSGTVTVRVGLKESEGLRDAVLAVRANGTACTATDDLDTSTQYGRLKGQSRYTCFVDEVAARVAQFDVPLSTMRAGRNAFEVGVADGPPQTVTWLEVYVAP
ncbi:MAG: hypothetical protein GY851_32545 [bacterium]|nr:hypothetical protein [bacterium]